MTTTIERDLVAPERFIWTRAQYEHATELGLFGPDDHIELIEGEIVQKMIAPKNLSFMRERASRSIGSSTSTTDCWKCIVTPPPQRTPLSVIPTAKYCG